MSHQEQGEQACSSSDNRDERLRREILERMEARRLAGLPNRTLEATEMADLIEIAHAEEHVMDLISRLQARGYPSARYFAIARTDIEKGFMALERAITRPAGLVG